MQWFYRKIIILNIASIKTEGIQNVKIYLKYIMNLLKDLCYHFRTRNLDYKTYLHDKFKLGECNKKSNNFGDFIPINFISKDWTKLIFLKY